MKLDLSLYLVATCGQRSEKEFLEILKGAIEGGVSIIQLREKTLSSRKFYELACKVKELTDRFNIPLLINDRIDIALACDASGVHIGRANDLPIKVARKILGKDKILGLSTNQLHELDDVEGADYLGVGAAFATPSKSDCIVIGIDGIREISKIVSLPIVAIGGINEEVIPNLKGINLAGVAVVRAIMDAKDPKLAAQNLKRAFMGIKQA